ncbi:cell envelope-related Asp23 family protein [Kribbella amoyensis]|uniref:Cell envelope-related Asp23 family protein n=1 Tax=Kribbella amoyensis TaxID=996641 RepID=A0A561BUJ1_9ACTN|nr:Asp23/Gls24 family envelope stress response protein [Kribbella amoyensis]TWD82518.1 cell envelope-related Asp23 family protein [Kribbella amoyensis]
MSAEPLRPHTPPDREVERIALAEAAAQAARAIPGVVRLQPGLVGLLKQLAAQTWERATGRPVPDVAGVDVDLTEDRLKIDLRLVVTATHPAATIGEDTHRAVTKAVEARTDRTPTVRILIAEIELPGER